MKSSNLSHVGILGLVLIVAGVACSTPPSPSTVESTPPASATSSVPQSPVVMSAEAQMIAQAVDVLPFPYSGPLPPAVPSSIDGVYTRTIEYFGTPTPCKRCAEYRIEGGVTILSLDKGVFKFYHPATGFRSVGSFTVSGQSLTLFNDPNCEEDMSMRGYYAWTMEGNILQLKVTDDRCSIGLRWKNLTAAPWTRIPNPASSRLNPCEPPNREAAVTDHWNKPAGC